MSQGSPFAQTTIEETEVLDLLTGLVDRSLAIRDDSTGRYRLLESVRQFCRDRLLEVEEIDLWRDRHLAYFVSVGEAAEPHLAAGDQQAWLERLNTEHDNLRAALDWCAGYASPRNGCREFEPSGNSQRPMLRTENSLRLAASIWRFWYVRGHFTEGRERLAELLACTPLSLDPPARASALTGAGVLAYCQGDYAASRTLFEESLGIRRELDDSSGVATLLNNLGNVAYDQGEYERARALFEESLALRRALGEERGIAATLNNLGNVLNEQGDYAGARALFEESVAIKEEIGDQWGLASSLSNLGNVAFNQGDYTSAGALFTKSLTIRRELGDVGGAGISLNNLGNVALALNDYVLARDLFRESLDIRRKLGDRWGIAFSFEGIAAAEAGLGGWRIAARLWGAAERLRSEIGAPVPLNDRPRYDEEVARTRDAATNHRAFDSAWRDGRTMSVEEAMELAM